MRIVDARGTTLELPRPPAICNACLSDAGCWYSGHGILAAYCSHALTCASWDASRCAWIITAPIERNEFVTLVAARIAQHAAEQTAAPGARH